MEHIADVDMVLGQGISEQDSSVVINSCCQTAIPFIS